MKQFLFDVSDTTRDSWWNGRTQYVDVGATLVYLVFCLAPLFAFAVCDFGRTWLAAPGWTRGVVVLYGAVISLAPSLWLWIESAAFFDWSAAKYAYPPGAVDAVIKTKDARLKEARERFKVHTDGTKAIWAGVIALYAGALLKFGAG